MVDEAIEVRHGSSDPLVTHAKMLRFELLKVKADLDHELEDFSLNCSQCGLDVHWVSGLGITPGPGRTGRGVVVCEFLTLETVFLDDPLVPFFIELSTRRVHVAGSTSRPDSAWVTQLARNLAITGRLEDRHILLRDRDQVLRRLRRGPSNRRTGDREDAIRAPKANAFAERWVGSVRRECLDHVPVPAHHNREESE